MKQKYILCWGLAKQSRTPEESWVANGRGENADVYIYSRMSLLNKLWEVIMWAKLLDNVRKWNKWNGVPLALNKHSIEKIDRHILMLPPQKG